MIKGTDGAQIVLDFPADEVQEDITGEEAAQISRGLLGGPFDEIVRNTRPHMYCMTWFCF